MCNCVKNPDEIIKNFLEFGKINEHHNNKVFERLTNFSHWYYYRNIFAPNKFLLIANTTLDNYDNEAGHRTNEYSASSEYLSKYFIEILKNNEKFKILFEGLSEFAKNNNFKLNSNVHIHILNDSFIKKSVLNQYNDEKYIEGKTKKVFVNTYERNIKARKKCIEHYGYECSVCGLLLKNIYGSVAENFIHIHHLKELFQIKKEYELDPINDLRPVCPNCHAIIHRKSPAMKIDELKEILLSLRCKI